MRKFSHVIFIAYQPITLKFKKDFYIDRLSKEGFETEYWDLSGLFKRHTNINANITGVKQFKIDNWLQLKKNISQYCGHSLFIFSITYYGRVYKLFRVFSKYNCATSIFARGALPNPAANYSLRQKISFKFKALLNPKYVTELILNQLAIGAKKNSLVKPYDFVFYAGATGISNIGYGYKYGIEKSELIPVNSFDYDEYLFIKEKNCQPIPQKYCVFLDSYLPYHPDFKLLNLPQLNPDEYYGLLNHFFSWIEQKYNVEVVIAAHPKSNYDEKKSYGKRMVIKNKTAELVKYADFVLSHVSSSVSFAVLFQKPLVFIYTNAIKEIYPFTHYRQVIHFSELLNTALVNTDEAFQNTEIMKVDKDAYNQYKYNYLTSPQSEQQFSEDIFIHVLKNYVL